MICQFLAISETKRTKSKCLFTFFFKKVYILFFNCDNIVGSTAFYIFSACLYGFSSAEQK